MPAPRTRAYLLLVHPLRFAARTIRGFNANQGLLMAGAIAYYALLSLIPLLILSVIAASHLLAVDDLVRTLARYLEWLVPSQSEAVLRDVTGFLGNRIPLGLVLLATLVFFSSLAFSILDQALGIIFAHRGEAQARAFLTSAVLPYCFVMLMGMILLVVTLVSVGLEALSDETVRALNREWSLRPVSGGLLYGLGFFVEAAVFTAMYLVLPAGRTRLGHALLGGATAAAIWEVVRHGLAWYFASLSQVSVVYGSLTTAIVSLFSLDVIAILVLFGAQVISEYERWGEA